MVKNNIIETTDLLSEEDELLLKRIEYIKKNIVNFIKPTELIDEIKSVIESSRLFSFKSKRNAKYISTAKPLFIMSMDREAACKAKDYEFNYNDGDNIEDRTDLEGDYQFIGNCIHEEITSKFSRFISEKLATDEFIKILEKNNVNKGKISKEQISLISFVTASLFGITVELRTNTIYLEYVI